MKTYRAQYRVVKYEYYTAYVQALDSDEAENRVQYGDVTNERLMYEEYEDPDQIELFLTQDDEADAE